MALVLCGAFIVFWLLKDPICTVAGGALVEDDGAAKADAILVLGGDGFGTRIVRGAQLEQEGYAPRVLVSSPVNLLGHESDQTIVHATRKGYPASIFEPVYLPEDVLSTRAEADYIGRQLKEEGVTSIDLVTSNYHTRRAKYLWSKQDPWLKVHVVPAPDPYFSPEGWFKNREGQKTFLMEWAKTVASHIGD